jgi:hypothetical protein
MAMNNRHNSKKENGDCHFGDGPLLFFYAINDS